MGVAGGVVWGWWVCVCVCVCAPKSVVRWGVDVGHAREEKGVVARTLPAFTPPALINISPTADNQELVGGQRPAPEQMWEQKSEKKGSTWLQT